MSIFDTLLGVPLGYILYACFWVIGSFGWAIIVFTLLTKVLLLPLSVMAQRNAITMVRIRPDLEDVKRRFEGNNTLILDEQRALYKREHYSSWKAILPLLVQVPIILGVIQVVYHPLRHLCHLSAASIDALVARAATLLGTTPGALGSAAQTRVIDLVSSRASDFTGVVDPSELAKVAGVDLHFLGLNLGEVPVWTDASMIWPFAAGLSALALGLYQNRYYVLQRFAGPGSRWGITAFLVAFSFYFALILPGAFGLYWTAANLLSIAVVWVCNRIDNPRKLLDYDALARPKGPSRAERVAARRDAREAKVLQRASIKAFNACRGKQVMIYSEGSGYWKYYARLVGWLLDNTQLVIHYVTSDPHDRVFSRASDRLRTYYVGPRALIAFMMRLDVDICLMTTPDLQKYHIKRSLVRDDVEYVYLDHGMASLHMMLREGALDHFDTIFCYGPNHVDEVRQTEAAYGLPPKRCVETGYGLLDDLLDAVGTSVSTNETSVAPVETTSGKGTSVEPVETTSGKGTSVEPVETTSGTSRVSTSSTNASGVETASAGVPQVSTSSTSGAPTALVAPSWQAQNLLELCPAEVIQPLLDAGFRVIVRPHPEFVKRFGPKYAALQARFANQVGDRLEFQSDFSSNSTVYESDVVVTDWSTIAQEFSYTTKKPSIFVNTPMKVMNPNYKTIAAEPLDITLRDQIGRSLDVDELGSIGDVARAMVDERESWRDRIAAVVKANIFHIGSAADAMGSYVVESVARHQRARDLAAARAAEKNGTTTPEQVALLADEAALARQAEIADVEAKADALEALAKQLRAKAATARE